MPDDFFWKSAFLSYFGTIYECSAVCEQHLVPDDVQSEPGWRALKVKGPLSFELTGVLSQLIEPMAEVQASIFAISTYDTDYILVKQSDVKRVIAALEERGHKVKR